MSAYFFSNDNIKIVFFSEIMEVFTVEENEIDLIKKLIDRKDCPDNERINYFRYLISKDSEPRNDIQQNISVVNSLILHISNDCNMKCKYCFADGGSYSSEPGFMSSEAASKAVDFFYKRFNYINEIKFFGGEPLLNISVIKDTCEKITDLFLNKVIKKMPLFKVVTNGTLINDNIISVINKYDIDITVSIDGPEAVHDSARVKNNGSATYEVIEKNIMRLKQLTGGIQPRYLEVTYNASHEKSGMSVVDTIKFLIEKFNILPEKINLSFVQTNEKSEYAINDAGIKNIDYIKDVKNNINNNKEYYTHQKLNCMLRNYKNKTKTGVNVCMGGISWFSVFYNGDIYPCYMLSDKGKGYLMGNVFEENNRFFDERSKWLSYNRYEMNKCNECFANNLCSGCLGNNLFATGDALQFSEKDCCAKREFYKEILLGIADKTFHI